MKDVYFKKSLLNERGGVLIEFALVALIFYMLMAATFSFGKALFSVQALQDAARLAARELSVTPLPAEIFFEEALDEAVVRDRVFDEDFLVIDVSDPFDVNGSGLDLDSYFNSLPVVNQMLRPLMMRDRVGGVDVLRYPGALFESLTAPSGLTVAIPLVRERGDDGVETIDWIPVLEELNDANTPDPVNPAPFTLSNGGNPGGGMVALRLNYPYQSAMLSGFQQSPDGMFSPNAPFRIRADDGAVTVVDISGFDPGAPIAPDDGVGSYAGLYGLGRQLAFTEELRPFRKLLSAQAAFKREVYT